MDKSLTKAACHVRCPLKLLLLLLRWLPRPSMQFLCCEMVALQELSRLRQLR
jgi:hypothetical protein